MMNEELKEVFPFGNENEIRKTTLTYLKGRKAECLTRKEIDLIRKFLTTALDNGIENALKTLEKFEDKLNQTEKMIKAEQENRAISKMMVKLKEHLEDPSSTFEDFIASVSK
ncbi:MULTISPECIES: hypothetical protein [Pasteurellaceae]|uniref:Uncharacterized protein n=1 Tax=Pasteurella atlantica TaxID=2827233 RepID=A0AAW8CR16_9PAST|nr:hypothetical protein [Pasteurella atlantica]MBR0573371.1 hypothetical protein [Pasteurella atlantica]MDP8039821.1 hypothetical protein [Pasteurella atlantica]MDP8041838.1 hypothetical protein [Pasteurella atlantica]MDP8043905.1 hypothetical protein [Pasteurella atlantica]MDP8046092.1 hypothetical protein [Pasteurella atlantica]